MDLRLCTGANIAGFVKVVEAMSVNWILNLSTC